MKLIIFIVSNLMDNAIKNVRIIYLMIIKIYIKIKKVNKFL